MNKQEEYRLLVMRCEHAELRLRQLYAKRDACLASMIEFVDRALIAKPDENPETWFDLSTGATTKGPPAYDF